MYKCVALPSPLDPIDRTFIVASCEPRTVSRLTVSHSIAPSASTLTTLPPEAVCARENPGKPIDHE